MSSGDIGEITTVKLEYKWVINNYSMICGRLHMGCYIKSPIFSVPISVDRCNNCELWLYPRGNLNVHKDYLSVFLHNVSDTKFRATASFRILNAKNEMVVREKTSERTFMKDCAFGSPQFARQAVVEDKTNGVLNDDKLTIVCKVTVIANREVKSRGESELSEPIVVDDYNNSGKNTPLLREIEEYEDLKDFSDVSFVVEGKTLWAHKNILAQSSPMFSAMFRASPEEKKLVIAMIDDVKHDVFLEMLRFVYVGKVSDIDNVALDLLAAADKYSLAGLKVICEQALRDRNLSVDNALESLEIADKYRLDDLRGRVVDFVAQNADNFIENPEFKSLKADVLYQVCRAMAKRKSATLQSE